MTLGFNVDEILQMAERIEQNGAQFYRQAASAMREKPIEEKLLELADMEDAHRATFARMRETLHRTETPATTFDPDGETEQYLMAMADATVFGTPLDPGRFVVDSRSLTDILNAAIDLERESILFYTGLRGLVPERMGRDRVEEILKEEMSHVVLLRNQLASLR
jgi:rubrerythrin